MKKNVFRLLIAIICIIVVIAIVSLIKNLDSNSTKAATLTTVGSSMTPLIPAGQEIQADYSYYQDNQLEKGDVVLIEFPGKSTPLVKVVKGVGGDRIEFESINQPEKDLETPGKYRILINGKVVQNSQENAYQISEETKNLLAIHGEYIPELSTLVLGDNENGSFDSTRFGLTPKSRIIAKVVKY